MKPEQAFQAAVGQLQMEMPKAAFDTWVRSTKFVSYDGEIFVIGTLNAYARDWLDSRLTSTITRLLTGIMNKSIQTRFIVLDAEIQEDAVDTELLENDDLEQDADADQPDDRIDLQGEYKSIYDEIVKPDRVIVFRGYFLRYLPLLGHELAWIYNGK